jgi:hypothetical protein
LQAAIAACHARARTAAETDWPRIAALYATLAALAPSPVVELNRAVAVAMADGPARLALVDALTAEPALTTYHLLPGCAATSCRSSAAATRPARVHAAPPRSPATRASAKLLLDLRRGVRVTTRDRSLHISFDRRPEAGGQVRCSLHSYRAKQSPSP